jgi:hypothetical protein
MTDSGSNGKKGKGFAGLDSMVSDVSEDVERAARAAPCKAPPPEPPAETPLQPARPERRPAPAESAPSSGSGKLGLGWVIIGAIGLVIWIANSGSGNKSKPVPSRDQLVSPQNSPDRQPDDPPTLTSDQAIALAAGVQAGLHAAIADRASPEPEFATLGEKIEWLTEMSRRLEKRIPDRQARLEFLKTVYYEAQRAGLDPQLVLSLIQVVSGFEKYAVSSAGARGYMQVMPFWVKLIGNGDENLFHLRTNLRFGCTILRYYLDIEKGDLYRALGRYNGSLGAPEYPNMVRDAWERQWGWGYTGKPNTLPATAAKPKDKTPPLPAPVRSPLCNIDFNINLETFGESVTVELRVGVPGNSSVLSSKRSTGGHVGFSGLCPGQHFVAIGNGDSVSVTPTRAFESGHSYTSTLRLQRGAGNVSKRMRGEL